MVCVVEVVLVLEGLGVVCMIDVMLVLEELCMVHFDVGLVLEVLWLVCMVCVADVGLVILGLWVVCMVHIMLVLERVCMVCGICMVDVALIERGLYSTTKSASASLVQSSAQPHTSHCTNRAKGESTAAMEARKYAPESRACAKGRSCGRTCSAGTAT